MQSLRCICRCRSSGIVGRSWIQEITLRGAAQTSASRRYRKVNRSIPCSPANSITSPRAWICTCRSTISSSLSHQKPVPRRSGKAHQRWTHSKARGFPQFPHSPSRDRSVNAQLSLYEPKMMEAVLNHEAAQQAGGSVVQPQKSQRRLVQCLFMGLRRALPRVEVPRTRTRSVGFVTSRSSPLHSFERVGKHWRIR